MNKMLTVDTKRKIDSARDILVGKIPDPKAQVEQITTALIYKFMDDMDQEALEIGGKARYFTGDFEKYSWHKVMDTKLGAQERMNLYSEAIGKFQTNPNLPSLFRDIFKDSFLPFRNPETLTLFLRQINEFTYDHSEDLGDAYEYLLSIMGSQGDAGQFRTPRHIIEFIVKVVDPKKEDTVLDPACGTSGFLISAYKHILAQHDGKDDVTGEPIKSEKRLTPQDRSQITKNFVGYDISPDMVRISEVNMFLHDFTEPKIYEYDTLSSEDKWDDRFDVILANPPFMSPKGGIRPHKRFSIQANRSEVLFVDYIMEHLKPKGRAGIIVPEGIIFQSSNAYVELRKKLIEDGLFCVVSLPSGVFQPYSGVKTSILLFDNEISKKVRHMMFVKINNDGFELGTQRKPSVYNDLPLAEEAILKYRKHVNADGKLSIGGWPEDGPENIDTYPNLQFFSKAELLKSAEHNLTVSRYATNERGAEITGKWPEVELGDVLEYEQPTKYIVTNESYNDKYKIPVLTAGKTFILGYTKEEDGIYNKSLPVIIFDDFTTATKLVDFPFKVKSSAMKILHAKADVADIKYLFYMMQKIKFSSSTHKRYWISEYSKLKIPLPPIDVQQKIVQELGGYQRIIDGAKQVVRSWKPSFQIDPSWGKVKLSELADLQNGYAFKSQDYVVNSNTLNFRMSNIKPDGSVDVEYNPKYLPDSYYERYKEFILIDGDVVIAMTDMAGDPKILGVPTIVQSNGKRLLLNQRVGKFIKVDTERILTSYLKYALQRDEVKELYKRLAGGGVQINISKGHILGIKIPLPAMDIQREIVEKIEAEKKIVESNKKLIEIYEAKIKNKISEVWAE